MITASDMPQLHQPPKPVPLTVRVEKLLRGALESSFAGPVKVPRYYQDPDAAEVTRDLTERGFKVTFPYRSATACIEWGAE